MNIMISGARSEILYHGALAMLHGCGLQEGLARGSHSQSA
jgi:hypothetical protein